jgi:hypothetical protein
LEIISYDLDLDVNFAAAGVKGVETVHLEDSENPLVKSRRSGSTECPRVRISTGRKAS